MINTAYLYELLNKLEANRATLQKNVLDVNEAQIYQADYKDRAELFKSHDAIVNYINDQTDIINMLTNEVTKMYSKEYVKDLQTTISKQRYFIKVLGGNPSNINYIKNDDIQC
jgi:uncharacterized protein YqgQ